MLRRIAPSRRRLLASPAALSRPLLAPRMLQMMATEGPATRRCFSMPMHSLLRIDETIFHVPQKRWASSNATDDFPSDKPSGTGTEKSEGRTKKKKMKRRRPQVAGGGNHGNDGDKRSGGKRNRSPIKMLTQSQARGLFDEIAPHLPLTLLRAMCNFLKRKKKLADKEGSFGSKLDTLWKNEPDRRKIPPKWVKDALRQALITGLVGQTNSSSSTKKATYRKTKGEAGYTPQVNRQNWEKNINALMEVRELWVEFQPSGKKKKKKSKGKATNTDDLSSTEVLTEKKILHLAKTTQELRTEAEIFLSHLADQLPSDDFRKFAEHITDIHNTVSTTSTTICISPSMAQALFWNSTKTHIHLVIDEMASFFYVNLTTDIHTKRSKNLMAKATKQWDELRERFSMTLTAFQKTVLERKPASKKEQEEEAIGDFDLDLHKKKIAEPVEGEGEAVVEKKKKRPKKRRPSHVRLDAMLLTDDIPSIPHADKMVFIDNLPIDISEMELFDLYSRCGPIQSVSIFNQRPDLDPGTLSVKQVRDRKRRLQTNRRSSMNRSKWVRPKTPIYALVTFATDDGFHAACDAPLRLFGMVVRKHALRTLRASDMTKLYVEHLPPGVHSADLEYQMAKILREKDIYVCLDLGQHTRNEPTSCEITFPSFEVAYSSYDKVLESIEIIRQSVAEAKIKEAEDVEEKDNKSEIAVNWLRTPNDALSYWTREVGFET